MVDAGEEIREIADRRRQMQPAGASLPAGLEADLGDPLSHGADYIRRARGLGAQ